MRTVKKIKQEIEQALIKAIDHYNNCDFCQTHGEHGIDCALYDMLLEEVETLRDEIDYKEQIFQQELIDRNLTAIKKNKDPQTSQL